MNPTLINILRWLAIIPAYIAGNVVSTVVFHLLSVPIDLQLIRDLDNSSDLAGHWLEGPIFLINKYLFTGFCAGYACIWVAPEKHRKIAFKIVKVFSVLGVSIIIISLVLTTELLLEGKSVVRFSLEVFPNFIGIFFGAYMASKNQIQSVSPEDDPPSTL